MDEDNAGTRQTRVSITDQKVDEQIAIWLEWDKNEETLAEIKKLDAAKKRDELKARLLNRMPFGIPGLKGVMRAGNDSMNDLTIIQTAQGISSLLMATETEEDRTSRGIVVGYDGRYKSKRFAELITTVFVGKGFKVWLYSHVIPTPFISFSVLHLHCLAGLMVTASHYPKNQNGLKIYWDNGAHVVPPIEAQIQESISSNLKPLESSWQTDALSTSPLVFDPYTDVCMAYLDGICKNLPESFLEINAQSSLQFVYTALHGVGYASIRRAFEQMKLKPVIEVSQQCEPNPDFPTIVGQPSFQEDKSIFEMAIKKADSMGVSIIIANDPDADDMACAEKNAETLQWKMFDGNEVGALLGWWATFIYARNNPEEPLVDCYILSSAVSSMIFASIAKVEDFTFVETLPGFKWIGNVANVILQKNKVVLFAFEESMGYMCSPIVLDKDGINAACQLATMACFLRSTEGVSLAQKLDQIYTKYGLHLTTRSYLICYDPPLIAKIFQRLRTFDNNKPGTYPRAVGKYTIRSVRDLLPGVDTARPDGKSLLPSISDFQMITFTFDNGLVFTMRTSTTEPKIKYYAEMCAKPNDLDWDMQRDVMNEMLTNVVRELIQPETNGLIRVEQPM